MGNKPKKKKMTVKEVHEILINEESTNLLNKIKLLKQQKILQKIMVLCF